MFRRRWHQYLAVYLLKEAASISVLSREVKSSGKMTFRDLDKTKELVCERDGYKPDDLVLINLIYLGKGAD